MEIHLSSKDEVIIPKVADPEHLKWVFYCPSIQFHLITNVSEQGYENVKSQNSEMEKIAKLEKVETVN